MGSLVAADSTPDNMASSDGELTLFDRASFCHWRCAGSPHDGHAGYAVRQEERQIILVNRWTCMSQRPGIRNLPAASTVWAFLGARTVAAGPMAVMRLAVTTTI